MEHLDTLGIILLSGILLVCLQKVDPNNDIQRRMYRENKLAYSAVKTCHIVIMAAFAMNFKYILSIYLFQPAISKVRSMWKVI